MPDAAFGAHPEQLWTIAAHLLVAIGCLYVVYLTDRVWLCALMGVVIGTSSYGLATMSHYLSHGAIVRNRGLRYALEFLLWGWLGHSATVWAKTHTQTHHAGANGTRDPDRRFTPSERRWNRTLFHALFYPHRHFKWNPLTLLAYGVLSKVYIVTAVLGVSENASPMGPVACQERTRSHRARIELGLGAAAGDLLVVRSAEVFGHDRHRLPRHERDGEPVPSHSAWPIGALELAS
jgi:hypothetical protein